MQNLQQILYTPKQTSASNKHSLCYLRQLEQTLQCKNFKQVRS